MPLLNNMKIDADRAMLLLIDFQEKLLPQIHEARELLVSAAHLMHGAKIFSLPIVATEQYRRGLGATHTHLSRHFAPYGVRMFEKMTFSCGCDDMVRAGINEIDRPQVIVAGIEAHVCVSQTVLDLIAMDFQVFVCVDAINSRRPQDCTLAIQRMRDCGATATSVESVLFELCAISGTEKFKELLTLIKDRGIGAREVVI